MRLRMMPVVLTLAPAIGASLPATAAGRVLHVAPQGAPDNPATESAPLRSLADAAAQAAPGDTIRLACGTYKEHQAISLQTNGTAARPIRVESSCSERAVLDFAAQPEDRRQQRGIEITGDHWHIVDIEVVHAGGEGFYVTGSHNHLERCVARDNRGSGIQLDAGASYNLILSCDSYRNFDPANHGENADGFAAKHALGPGNVFRAVVRTRTPTTAGTCGWRLIQS